jgi:hypothetical protein
MKICYPIFGKLRASWRRIPSVLDATKTWASIRIPPLARDSADGTEHLQGPVWRSATQTELINRRRGITAGTALRLAKFFGTSGGFWMNLQLRWKLYRAQEAERNLLKRIRRVRTAG